MLQYDGPDTFLQDGYMKLWKASLLPGNRANKFMIDFDGKYQSARGTLDPDSDGTQAPFVKASSADIDKNKKIVLSNPNWGGYLIGVFKHGVPVDDLAKKAMQAAGLSGKVSARQVNKGGSQSVSAISAQQTAQTAQTAQTTANTNTVPTAPATPKVVGATSNSSSTVSNTATSKPVSAKGKAKVNFKFNTSGTEDNFTVDLSGLEITCTKASENGDVKTYDVSVKGRIYVSKPDVFYDIYLVSNDSSGCNGYKYLGKVLVEGIDNYDLYLGSKLLPYSKELATLTPSERSSIK